MPLILGSSYILKLILSWVQEDDLIGCVVGEVGGGGGGELKHRSLLCNWLRNRKCVL